MRLLVPKGLVLGERLFYWRLGFAAILLYRVLAKWFPQYRRVLVWQMAFTYERQGKLQKAISLYEDLIDRDSDDAGAHYSLGCALEATGRPELAMDHYKRALANGTALPEEVRDELDRRIRELSEGEKKT